MQRGAFLWAIFGILSFSLAQSPATQPTSPMARFVDKQVNILNTGADAERVEAAKKLQELPGEALPLLKEALQRTDLSAGARNSLVLAQTAVSRKIELATVMNRLQQRHKWYQKIFVDEYEKVGVRNPRWDKDARIIMAAAARSRSRVGETGDESQIVWEAARRFNAARGQDPLVIYLRARNYAHYHRDDPKEIARQHIEAAEKLATSDYHPLHKLYAFARAAQYRLPEKPDDAQLAQARKEIDEALKLLPLIAADTEIPANAWEDIADVLADISRVIEGDRMAYPRRVFPFIDKADPSGSLSLSIKGSLLIAAAWDARGRGFADTVEEEGWKLFHERLTEARTALTEAYARDPYNEPACRDMMTIALADGGDREEMETWYQRSRKLNPMSAAACYSKLNFLEPKWHGSIEELLQFGEECRATNDHAAGVPMVFVYAHLAASRYGPKGYEQPRPEYFRSQPDLWPKIKEVFEGHMRAKDDSIFTRCEYAKLAVWSEQWQDADQIFTSLSDDFSFRIFNEEDFKRLKVIAAEKAKAAPAKQ